MRESSYGRRATHAKQYLSFILLTNEHSRHFQVCALAAAGGGEETAVGTEGCAEVGAAVGSTAGAEADGGGR